MRTMLKTIALLLCIWTPSLSEAKKSLEPIVKPIMEVGGNNIVMGFESIAEYRDWLSVIVTIIIFSAREWYQFKRDKERLASLEESRKSDSKKIDDMEKDQAKMFHELRTFIKSVEKDEERMDRRVSRIESGDRQ